MNSKFVPAIQKPCPANWNAMPGDEKRRFCEHCQLHVHNLSEMTTHEQVTLMKSPGERKCVTYTAPTNAKPVDVGTWLTLQTATGWRRALAAMLAAAFSMFATSCRTTGTPPPPSEPKTTLGRMQVNAEMPVEDERPVVFGDPKNPIAGGIMCPPTPWWKKMLFLD